MLTITCINEEETRVLGEKLANILKPGDFVSLNGSLGTGKTFLSKAVIKNLDVEDYVTSPSYTIVNEYEGRYPIYHFDVYRIDDIDEMYEIGYEEYFFGEGVCLVEWGEMVRELYPEDYIQITLKMCESFTSRVIEIEGSNEKLKKRLEALTC